PHSQARHSRRQNKPVRVRVGSGFAALSCLINPKLFQFLSVLITWITFLVCTRQIKLAIG
ncbi:hypothetical protein, partial [Brucella intermedia]|uniref:hypothetical protein n=1 Tax=Brucella intermedia TaxID=94625 RepID=UPI00236264E8